MSVTCFFEFFGCNFEDCATSNENAGQEGTKWGRKLETTQQVMGQCQWNNTRPETKMQMRSSLKFNEARLNQQTAKIDKKLAGKPKRRGNKLRISWKRCWNVGKKFQNKIELMTKKCAWVQSSYPSFSPRDVITLLAVTWSFSAAAAVVVLVVLVYVSFGSIN